jgi:transcriptional regulatory protein RtcR
VIGFLGSTLDAAKFGPSRWNKWRPSISICMQEDLRVDRFVLIHGSYHRRLAEVIIEDIRDVSPETEVVPHIMDFKDAWDFEEVYGKLLDFARGFAFHPDTQDYLVHITTGTHVAQICLFLLAEARYLPGRLLQTQPARGGPSPIGTWSAIDLDLSRYDSLASRFVEASANSTSFLKNGIDTRNSAFNRMIEQIEQVASRSSAPILLMGPTGAGKSQLARRIYELKKLRHQIAGPFAEVNCATLRGDGAMSALFGHKRGAFTSAVADRLGLLKAADTGLLFLDEIGELGLDEQAMILRAVEEGRFLSVGADKETTSRFQLIAGTNRDLVAEVGAGRFREDLFARLNLWTFTLPGLAERREDIAPNLDYELERFAAAEGNRVTFNKEARELFLRFAEGPSSTWSGNFRDLAASITRMATLCSAGRIDMDAVVAETARLERLWSRGKANKQDALPSLLGPERLAALDPFDRVQLAFVVEVCRSSSSLSDAGRTLFAASRQQRQSTNDADRLRKYMAKFGLDWATITQPAA